MKISVSHSGAAALSLLQLSSQGMCATLRLKMKRAVAAQASCTQPRPRGDITGAARFVDMRNRLCCEVEFGKLSGAEDRLLQRSDAISGSLFSFISEPKNAPNGGLVRISAITSPPDLSWDSIRIIQTSQDWLLQRS